MPWIEEIPPEHADGLLEREYRAAVKRAGRIWHIVSLMSQSPKTLRDSMKLYRTVMKEESPLSRVQRELLATVVSAELDCFY